MARRRARDRAIIVGIATRNRRSLTMDERNTLTRRSFLGFAGALPIAWAVGRALPAWAAARIPVALQLYSVRGDCKQNFDAALEQAGIDQVFVKRIPSAASVSMVGVLGGVSPP
mgnify:CR=1 FL=1